MKQALMILGRWGIMSMILAIMALTAACIDPYSMGPYMGPLYHNYHYNQYPVYRQQWYNQPYYRVNNQYQRQYRRQQRGRVKTGG
ncbi:MAG: hypothetical protein KKC37_01715, partial [Proteobacteria bacterium]|nr:hypothetical protein [Pseudomonadota bacterium]